MPEAISWHFAGMWKHMSNLIKGNNIDSDLEQSLSILNRSVAIPINVKMPDKIETKIKNALSIAIN